ncbi:MAG: HEPN domain-containing protein [Lachnospiraceae bacterium]|nr:HEPN domain-containing protein [Lachnospiraceae bacterium]
MSTMYERFNTWRHYAIEELNASKGFDSELDKACFDTQQALEFLIKAILLQYGISFDKVHDIVELSGLLEQTDIEFEKKDDLDLLATTITSWEELARYSSGIKTKQDTVRRVMNIIDNLNEAFLKKQEENNPE